MSKCISPHTVRCEFDREVAGGAGVHEPPPAGYRILQSKVGHKRCVLSIVASGRAHKQTDPNHFSRIQILHTTEIGQALQIFIIIFFIFFQLLKRTKQYTPLVGYRYSTRLHHFKVLAVNKPVKIILMHILYQ